MKITLASAMGTCFGVQDAIDLALQPEFRGRLTIVGQLVHNPQTVARLLANGVRIVERDQLESIATPEVMITAHGAADGLKAELRARGFTVHDATCPLVLRLHKLARFLENKGYLPVIVGQEDHVEVQGVVGNLRRSVVIGAPGEVGRLAGEPRLGVVAQTTSRVEKVEEILAALRALPGVEDLRFCDTVCQPVKDRQRAIQDLLGQDLDLGIVIGGRNSSNTAKLCEIIASRGIEAHHIEGPADLKAGWLAGKSHVGVTAGTSTPQEVIEAVHERLRSLVNE
jgi:4-hydroxy-3-methylbut-2-enyl diphosphate reductase